MKKISVLVFVLFVGCGLIWAGGSRAPAAESRNTAVIDGGRELIGNTYSTGLPIVKNPETFKIAVSRHNSDRSKSFMEKEAFIKAGRETGMNIDFIEITDGTATERISIMIASDPPDAFYGTMSETLLVQNRNSFVNFAEGDLLKKYSPKVSADIDKIPDGWNMLKFPDGSIYSLMAGVQVNYDNDGQGIQSINLDWLNKLGLKMPTNTAEYLNVLRAFRDRDPNGNGLKDEIPFGFVEANWANFILTYSGPWGMSAYTSATGSKHLYYFRIANGKIEPVANTQRFKDFLTFYHQLSTEGLLDPEGFSQTKQQYDAKRNANQYGTTNNWDVATLSPAIGKWVAMEPFSAPGYEFKATGVKDSFQGNRLGFVITKAAKNPTALLRWWDYLAGSTEMKYFVRYGKEGQLWERDGKGTVWTIFPEDTAADFTREIMKYTWGYFNGAPIVLKSEMEQNDPVKYPASVSRAKMVDTIWNSLVTERVPIRFVSPEAVRTRMFLETELNAYMDGFVANAILTGRGLDDAGWSTHLRQLEALQFTEWLQWYQDLLDGKIK
jgi:hypothetical protein